MYACTLNEGQVAVKITEPSPRMAIRGVPGRSPRNAIRGLGLLTTDLARHDCQTMLVGERDGLFLIDEDGLAGFDGEHAAAGAVQRLDRRHADSRHVEAHVLFRFGDLDDGEAARG